MAYRSYVGFHDVGITGLGEDVKGSAKRADKQVARVIFFKSLDELVNTGCFLVGFIHVQKYTRGMDQKQ